jgi:zinc transport system substrate-binding protein
MRFGWYAEDRREGAPRARSVAEGIAGTGGSRWPLLLSLRLLLVAFAVAAFGPRAGCRENGEKTTVFVSILPQVYFVERVGGPYVEVEVLVPPGQSPATYGPTAGQMVRLSNAKVLFTIGVPFEKAFLPKLASTHPDLRVVDTRARVELRPMSEEHAHGDEDERGPRDPHIWLDPKRVKIQAKTIHDELVRIDPGHAEGYRANLESFHEELDALDAKIAKILAPFKGRAFYVFHPTYGYFAERYGLQQVAVETEGKEPGPKHLASLIDRAKRDGVKAIFVQPQFSHSSAKTIAREIGGEVVTLDPLAKDYIRNLERMAEELRQALSGPGPAGQEMGAP